MTEERKIQDFFIKYLGSPNETRPSQPLIGVLQMELLKGDITATNIIKTLVKELDLVRNHHREYVRTHATPPPIIIAPETEEGKSFLKTIMEMGKGEE